LNGVLPVMGFVKNPVFGYQAEKKTITLPSGRRVITQDWVASVATIGNNVIILDDTSFDKTVNASNKIVLVDFWAPWCKPCKMMAPVIEGLSNDYKGKAKVCKLNVDECRKASEKFGVKSLPTIIIFKYGQEYERWTGFTNSSEISSAIDKRLEK